VESEWCKDIEVNAALADQGDLLRLVDGSQERGARSPHRAQSAGRYRRRAPGVFRRRQVAKARVRPHLVEVLPPGFELGPGVAEQAEQGLVQALVPQAPVEAFAEAVLLRLAGAM
jgi:hypothetical protein